MNERREEFRCNTENEVTVGGVSGTICNLSMGGMMCFLKASVPSMEELDITFNIKDYSITIVGTVLRCEEITKDNFSVGIYFKTPSMSEEVRNKLSKYLDDLRRKK
jgi:hypothetical protein